MLLNAHYSLIQKEVFACPDSSKNTLADVVKSVEMNPFKLGLSNQAVLMLL